MNTTSMRALRWFEGYGIELEYMIVDAETLAVRPVADELLAAVGGGYDMQVDRGDAAWSNELALHVIEMKSNGPSPTLAPLPALFDAQVAEIDALLAPMNARLMPTGMHPFMDPHAELRLWPHEDREIYETFDRIFDCSGHGWANLQSTHINLPFDGDDEFGRLHAAIRLILPLLPALAASSPVVEGRVTGLLDNRVELYRHNARRVPSVSGHVVPEPVFTRAAYEREILERIYDDMAPLDPKGVLRYEWVNARGCIARFDRMAIEIRLLDIQECPLADIAIAAAVVAAVRAIGEERLSPARAQRDVRTEPLEAVLIATLRDGLDAVVEDAAYVESLGYTAGAPVTVGRLWEHLLEKTFDDPSSGRWSGILERILRDGPLAARIVRALGPSPRPSALHDVYGELCACLAEGRPFDGGRR